MKEYKAQITQVKGYGFSKKADIENHLKKITNYKAIYVDGCYEYIDRNLRAMEEGLIDIQFTLVDSSLLTKEYQKSIKEITILSHSMKEEMNDLLSNLNTLKTKSTFIDYDNNKNLPDSMNLALSSSNASDKWGGLIFIVTNLKSYYSAKEIYYDHISSFGKKSRILWKRSQSDLISLFLFLSSIKAIDFITEENDYDWTKNLHSKNDFTTRGFIKGIKWQQIYSNFSFSKGSKITLTNKGLSSLYNQPDQKPRIHMKVRLLRKLFNPYPQKLVEQRSELRKRNKDS